jgi:hypothetical protein
MNDGSMLNESRSNPRIRCGIPLNSVNGGVRVCVIAFSSVCGWQWYLFERDRQLRLL